MGLLLVIHPHGDALLLASHQYLSQANDAAVGGNSLVPLHGIAISTLVGRISVALLVARPGRSDVALDAYVLLAALTETSANKARNHADRC
jgi:hypothetical protein